MNIITGFLGEPHVESEQDRDINIAIFGSGSYVVETGQKLTAEVSSNNEIKIRDGVIVHQGCAASIKKNTYDPVTITNGSQGMKRIDLIVARYQRNITTGVESLDLVAIQGTPSESDPAVPEYIEGDIQAGSNVVDMPLYQVVIDGLNIVEVNKVFEEIEDMTKLKKMISELNSKISAEKYVSILKSQSGTNYTHNIITTENINDFDMLLLDTQYGVMQAYKFGGTFKCTQIVYFSSGTWYAVNLALDNISTDGKSFTANIARWQSATVNAGVEITNVYGAKF